MPQKVNCDYCGKKTEVYPSDLESYDNHFCSRDCQSKWQSDNNSGENHHQYDRVTLECERCGDSFEVVPSRENTAKYCSKECQAGPKIEEECEVCGETFTYPPSHSDRNKRFCSEDCRGEWQSKAFAGENAPRWKGGKLRYYGPTWQRQRRKALKRDNHTCQACGRAEELHIHHIKPARTFDSTEKANKLNNLVTLCATCHHEWEGIPVRPRLSPEATT